MVGASHAGDVSRGSYTLTENVRVRENKGLYFRPSGFASASSGLGSPPGRKLMYSEERGPRRFQVPQQQHQHQHPQHMALIDQPGSSDSLVESAGGLLNTDAAVRLERERVERERAREQLERQRTRLEKDKALLGLSRSNITSMEEVGRPFNEARREFFAKLRDYGSVPRPATAPASKQSGVKRKTSATKGYTDANTELVRSLVENLSTTRSIEVRRKCTTAIEAEVSKLAHDAACLHSERVMWDEQIELADKEVQYVSLENSHLKEEMSVLGDKLVSSDMRIKDLIGRLAVAERAVDHLRSEEGCRDRLVQSLRQLEEEAEAKLLAEQQVREQMARIQTLTSEREAASRDLESSRREREGLKGKIAGMEERNNELTRQISKLKESKQGLMTRINQLEAEAMDNRVMVEASSRTTAEAKELHGLLQRTREDCNRAHARATQSLLDQESISDELREAKDAIKLLQHQNEMLRMQATKEGGELAAELPRLRQAVRERDAQCEEMGRKHKTALESMASELSMSAARNEDLRRKLSVLEEQVREKDAKMAEYGSTAHRLEEDNSRLQEHATLAAHQFHKLGDESARLLQACQVERDLRTKIEGNVQVKERQVSSLMEMNAKLSSELHALQGGGGSSSSASAAAAAAAAMAAHAVSTAGAGGGVTSDMLSSSPYFKGYGAGGGGSVSHSFDHGLGASGVFGAGVGAASKGGGDRQKLMDEIEALMTSFQSRH